MKLRRFGRVLLATLLAASTITVGQSSAPVNASLSSAWTDIANQLLTTVQGNLALPRSVVIGGGKILIVGAEITPSGGVEQGSNNVWVSNVNPVSFQALAVGSAQDVWFHSVAYGNGTFLAVGSSGNMQEPVAYSSTDGVSWTNRTNAVNFAVDATNNNWKQYAWNGDSAGSGAVIFNGTEFIVMGTAGNAYTWPNNMAGIARTTDGVQWSTPQYPRPANGGFAADGYFSRTPSATPGGQTFAVNGSTVVLSAGDSPTGQASLMVSTNDGASWTFGYDADPSDTDGSRNLFKVDAVVADGASVVAPAYQVIGYGNGKFVGLQADSSNNFATKNVATSPDGLVWTTITNALGQTAVRPFDLSYTGSQFVLLTDAGIFTSPNGQTWALTHSMSSAQSPGLVELRDFASSNGLAFVIGRDVDLNSYTSTPIVLFNSSYNLAPTVTAVLPTSGSTAGGTAITITGTDLGNASTVTVGSAACTNVVVVSATSITCTTPAGTAGTASIVVTAGGQSNVANTLFTYNAPATTTTTTTTTTTAPAVTTTTTAPAATTTTTAPATTAPVGPVNVTSSNQATLTQTPGGATAVVNGQPVTVNVDTPADLPAAQVDPEDRSPAQVQSLQVAADNLVDQLNQAAGGNSGLAVQDTPTGAAITGLLDKPVPIENTVLVEAGTKSTLFAALNQDGSVTEVQPGAVIEVLGDGQVGVVASGLTPGETAEFVIMSTPTLLGSYTVSANGTIKAQTSLPDGIGLGNHTLVVASPTVQASLGLKVSASLSTLPTTGASNGDHTMQIALWLLVGGLMVVYLRRRRLILN